MAKPVPVWNIRDKSEIPALKRWMDLFVSKEASWEICKSVVHNKSHLKEQIGMGTDVFVVGTFENPTAIAIGWATDIPPVVWQRGEAHELTDEEEKTWIHKYVSNPRTYWIQYMCAGRRHGENMIKLFDCIKKYVHRTYRGVETILTGASTNWPEEYKFKKTKYTKSNITVWYCAVDELPDAKVPKAGNGKGNDKQGGGKGDERKVRRHRRRKDLRWSHYILQLLKRVHTHGDMGISGKGMRIMDSAVNDLFERLAGTTKHLLRVNKQKTLSSRDVQTAVRLILPGELAKHAMSEGTKAVAKYTSN